VRLWARGETLRGKPVWVGTAQRCVDLTFDKASGTFRHRIDPDVDAEREKVAQDLASAKRVAARGQADRRPVTRGAVADRPSAAGPLAVLVLK
jgi:hypothetical protein